jgi:N-acetylmuramic acid 6-phosphate etherase
VSSSRHRKDRDKARYSLGIEGGGTKTIALVLDQDRSVLARKEYGPGNLRLLTDKAISGLLGQIADDFPEPVAVGIYLAGLRDDTDANRMAGIAKKIWPRSELTFGHDLEAALAAAHDPKQVCLATVIILSGTGSCCFGKNHRGKEAKVGGWGHLLGDKGSGYDIALSALRSATFHFDRRDYWSRLGERLLRRLLLNQPNDLIAFAQNAEKKEIAELAPEVFAAAKERDPLAREIISDRASMLATDAVRCAARLAARGERVHFVFAGSVLTGQMAFRRQIEKLIRTSKPKSDFSVLSREGAWGAGTLAAPENPEIGSQLSEPKSLQPAARSIYVPEFLPGASPTEQRNPASTHLDKLSTAKAVELILSEESKILPALRKQFSPIAQAVDLVSNALKKAGRLFYVGAGTSGRLGVLDASECPPTFRTDPEQIQGIMAGGYRALWQAVEGAEDDVQAGAEAIRFRGVTRGDVVLGIAASGRTPFVWGALQEAHVRKAKTIFLCFNPSLEISRKHKPDLVIAPNLGPEVLTGSTRLKCGTATKQILNIISTLSMVRLGKVISNLMIDLNPSNIKLRDRAIRILQQLTGCTSDEARAALEKSKWIVKDAWRLLRREGSRL